MSWPYVLGAFVWALVQVFCLHLLPWSWSLVLVFSLGHLFCFLSVFCLGLLSSFVMVVYLGRYFFWFFFLGLLFLVLLIVLDLASNKHFYVLLHPTSISGIVKNSPLRDL
jgi:hypothetical protein